MSVLTKHGEVTVGTEKVGDERTLIMLDAQAFDQVELARGIVLHRSSRWVKKRYDVFPLGLWDALSGIMRAKKSAMDWHESPNLVTFLEAVQESLRYVQLYSGMKGVALQRMKSLSLEVARALQMAENEHKVKAFYKLVRGSHTEDRSGKTNPGKSAAQLVSARDALRRRLRQVGDIYPFLDRDVLAMMTLVNEYHVTFDAVRAFGEHWWKRAVSKEALTPIDAKEFESGVKAAYAMLSSIKALPYLGLAESLQALLATDATGVLALRNQDLVLVTQAIRRACIAPNRLREVLQTNVQNGYLEIAPITGTEFEDTRDELGKKTLHVMWRAYRVIPDPFRTDARMLLSSVRKQYAEARRVEHRKWMLPLRNTVRDFAALIG